MTANLEQQIIKLVGHRSNRPRIRAQVIEALNCCRDWAVRDEARRQRVSEIAAALIGSDASHPLRDFDNRPAGEMTWTAVFTATGPSPLAWFPARPPHPFDQQGAARRSAMLAAYHDEVLCDDSRAFPCTPIIAIPAPAALSEADAVRLGPFIALRCRMARMDANTVESLIAHVEIDLSQRRGTKPRPKGKARPDAPKALTKPQRRVLGLEAEDRKPAEIAVLLDISLPSVLGLLKRAHEAQRKIDADVDAAGRARYSLRAPPADDEQLARVSARS